MNSISGDILAMTHKAVKRAEEEGVGLVIGNHGPNFSDITQNVMVICSVKFSGSDKE